TTTDSIFQPQPRLLASALRAHRPRSATPAELRRCNSIEGIHWIGVSGVQAARTPGGKPLPGLTREPAEVASRCLPWTRAGANVATLGFEKTNPFSSGALVH